MFTDTEIAVYHEVNVQAARLRAEFLILGMSAVQAAYVEVFEKYGLFDYSEDNLSEEDEAKDREYVGGLIEAAIDRTQKMVFDMSSDEIKEKYEILKGAAALIDEEDEREAK